MKNDFPEFLGGVLKKFREKLLDEELPSLIDLRLLMQKDELAGEKGDPGEKGEVGEKGDPGQDGKDGSDGAPGADRPIVEPVRLVEGKAYPKSTAGTYNGGLWISTRDANDDPSNDPSAWTCILEGWTQAKCDFLGDHQFQFKLSGSNGSEMVAEFNIPYPQHKGIYDPEESYCAGEIVTKGSAMFIASEPTDLAPPGGAWQQILVAPRGKQGPKGRDGIDGVDGKDGRDGVDGKEGPRGKPGRNGRDASLDPDFIAELKALASERKAFEDGREDSYAITSFRGYFKPFEEYTPGDVIVAYDSLYVNIRGGSFKAISSDPESWQMMFQTPAGLGPRAETLVWMGVWDPAKTYQPFEVVRDGDWLMVANRVTTERPAPALVGVGQWAIEDGVSAPAFTTPTASESAYITGNRFTWVDGGYLLGYRWYCPDASGNFTYEVWAGSSDFQLRQLIAPTSPAATGWYNIPASNLWRPNTTLDLMVIARSVNQPNTQTAAWDIKNTNGNPSSGEMNFQNSGVEMRVHKTDDDDADQSAWLEQVTVGGTISFAGVTWTITTVSDNGSHMRYGVSPNQGRPEEDTRNITFTWGVSDPIPYPLDTAHLSGLTGQVEGFEGTSYQGAPVLNDNAYGVDVNIVQASVSEAWDVMAASGGASPG